MHYYLLLIAEGNTGTQEGTRFEVSLRQAVAINIPPACCDCIIRVCEALHKNGTPEGTRTPDLLLRRQLLYPAELLAQI